MKKNLKTKILAVVLSVVVVLSSVALYLFYPLEGEPHNYEWQLSQEFDVSQIKSIQKNLDEEFVILQISDMQLWTRSSDNKATHIIVKELAEKVKPDLIILIGDNVSSLFSNHLVKDVIETLESTGIP